MKTLSQPTENYTGSAIQLSLARRNSMEFVIKPFVPVRTAMLLTEVPTFIKLKQR
jgi:hypothetical protein